MGLLDDPNALNALGLIGGLLTARKGDNWPLMLQQAAMRQEAIRRGQVEEDARRQQMEAQRLQMEQAKRAAAQQERADALLSQFQTPGVQPATRVDDNGNPMPASPSGFDFGGYARALAGVDPARSLALQAQLSQMGARERVKLGRDERLVDPNTGGVLASGIQSAPKLSYHDLGGYVSVRDEAGKEVGRLPKTEAPGAGRASSDTGKPPQGYRWRQDGSLEPIPGGPADAKVGKEADKERLQAQGALQKAGLVMQKVDEALGQIKGGVLPTTGASGAVLGRIPGTGAYDLDKTIDTIKANIGFTELQAMRAASPTGGALGQIAVRELDFLQAALGSLDRGQSRPQLERNLAAVKNHFNRWAEAVQQAGQEPQAKEQRVIDFNSLPK